MEILETLAPWERLALAVFLPSAVVLGCIAHFRKLSLFQSLSFAGVVCVTSYIAPILGFGLASWGFPIAGYVIFFMVILAPLILAWRSANVSAHT